MTNPELQVNVRDLIANNDLEALHVLTTQLSDEDWADIVSDLDQDEIATLLRMLPEDSGSDVLAELDPSHAAEIVGNLPLEEAADILEAMDPDDAADVMDEMSDEMAEDILVVMEPSEAAELRDLLTYDPDTAGGLMTPAFVSVSPTLRADQAVVALRKVSEDVETMYYVYVVDEADILLGVLPLHRLVLTRPDTRVSDLMVKEPVQVLAVDSGEEAANLLTEHDLLAIPVVNETGKLLGIITQDDIADFVEQEVTEDIERLGGSSPLDIPYRRAGVPLLVRRRLPWLLLLFAAEAYTGTVLRHFDDEMQQVVALSFFIPLLIGTGGNIGSQVTTTLVRAMAVGEVRLRDVRWVLAKEVMVGLVLGVIMAIVAFGRAEFLNVGSDVSAVIALTIFAICVWSATVAAVLPVVLRQLKVDPAVVSAPLITTLVDGTGLMIYFVIAKYMLDLNG